MGILSSNKRSRSRWKRAFGTVLAIVFLCAGLYLILAYSEARFRRKTEGAMRQMHAAFQLYAAASAGNYFPPRSAEDYLPDRDAWAKLGAGGAGFDAAQKAFGHDVQRPLCYLGYAFYDEASAQRVLDQLEKDPQALRGGGTYLGEEKFLSPDSPELDELCPLRTGAGHRFLWCWYVFAGLPPSEAEIADPIPLLWQMPRKEGDRMPVLHMSGMVTFQKYPGEFPMTPLFVNRVRGLMGLPQDPGFSMDTPIMPVLREILEAGSRKPGRGVGALGHFDAVPTVPHGDAMGYRITVSAGEMVLFPEGNGTGDIDATSLFEAPKGAYYGLPRWQAVRYMGASRGYRWYGKLNYGVFSLLQEKFELAGGDSLYDAAVSYWLTQETTWLWLKPGAKKQESPAVVLRRPASLTEYVYAYITARHNDRKPVPDEIIQAAALLCGTDYEGYGVPARPDPELAAEAKTRLIAAAEHDPESAVTLLLPYAVRYSGRRSRSEATPDRIEFLQRFPRDTVLFTVRHLADNLQNEHEAALCKDLLEKLEASQAVPNGAVTPISP